MGLQFGMQALQADAVLRAFMADQQYSCAWPFVSGEKWLRFGFLKPSAAVPASRGCFQRAWALGTGQVGRQGRVSIATFALVQGQVAIVFSCLKNF